MEKMKKEHHELFLRCAEKEVEKMPADHPAFNEDYVRDKNDKLSLLYWVISRDFIKTVPLCTSLLAYPSIAFTLSAVEHYFNVVIAGKYRS